MCDQAPALMVNDEIVTEVNDAKVKEIISIIKETNDVKKLVLHPGDGKQFKSFS